MDPVAVIFACSHRAGGNSMEAARLLREGVREAGGEAEIVELRGKTINHCLACGKCEGHPDSRCVFHHKDQAENLFDKLISASLVLFATPIYFYGPPSLFKAWIDRSQRFWIARKKGDERILGLPEKTALTVMHAGRPSGKSLFAGTALCMKYFLNNFNIRMADPLTFRGVETAGDYVRRPEAMAKIREYARSAWADLSE